MADDELADVDRAILHAHQVDARNTSSGDIAATSGRRAVPFASGSSVWKQRMSSEGTTPASTTGSRVGGVYDRVDD